MCLFQGNKIKLCTRHRVSSSLGNMHLSDSIQPWTHEKIVTHSWILNSPIYTRFYVISGHICKVITWFMLLRLEFAVILDRMIVCFYSISTSFHSLVSTIKCLFKNWKRHTLGSKLSPLLGTKFLYVWTFCPTGFPVGILPKTCDCCGTGE